MNIFVFVEKLLTKGFPNIFIVKLIYFFAILTIFNHILILLRLAWNNQKQNPIAPGKFQALIKQEKKNVAFDSEMH